MTAFRSASLTVNPPPEKDSAAAGLRSIIPSCLAVAVGGVATIFLLSFL
jgi:hypothetical protein